MLLVVGACLSAPYSSGAEPAENRATEPDAVGVEEDPDPTEPEPTGVDPADSEPARPPPEDPAVEEIVVTARRREESVQSVPMSVTAFTADDLAERSVMEIDDLAQYTPGFSMETAGASRPFAYIRGIGSGTFDAQSDPAVAFFVDEVYIPRFSGMTFDLFDVERVEILKGPQGTSFGRNAAGGAVSITTARPTDELAIDARAEVGNFRAWQTRASVSGPLVPGRLNGRLAAIGRGRDGYAEDRFTGNDLDERLAWGARGQLELLATADARVLSSVEVTQSRDGPWTQRNLTPNIFTIGAATDAGFPLPASGFWNTEASFVGRQDRDSQVVTARFDWDLDRVELIYLGNYRHAELDERQDDDSSIANAFDRLATEDTDQWSQELRLRSPDGQRFSWLVGFYYYGEETNRLDRWYFGTDSAAAVAPTVWNDRIVVETDSLAGFGEAAFAVTDSIEVSVGGRYTWEEKSADRRVSIPPLPGYEIDGLSESWDSFDPQVTLDYHVTEDVMLYGTWRNGFKSGGFQPAVATSPAVARTTFDPEDTESFEFGVKSQWFGSRLRLGLAGFVNTYSDMQVIQAIEVGPGGAPVAATLNAAEVDANGFELDFTAIPHPALVLSGGYAYTDATFDEFEDQTGADLSGNRNIRFPENFFFLDAEHTIPLPRLGNLTLRAEWSWRDRQYFEFHNIRALSQDPYHLLNLRAALTSESGSWRLYGFVANVTDEEICQNIAVVQENTVGWCTMDAPRRFGVGASWSY